MGSGRPAAAATRAVPRSAGPGETDRLDSGVGHEGDSEFGARPEQQGEGTRRQPRIGDRFGDRAADQFRGAGMGVVRLDHDGTSGGQRRRGIAAGYREGQREVAGAEDGDGAQRDGALANVGARQWLSVGQRRIDTGAVPAALTEHLGEQAQLARGAADLAGDAGPRKSGLRDGAGDDVVADGIDVGRDRLEEPGALLGRRRSVGGEGRAGCGACGVDVGLVAVWVGRFEFLPGAGVEGMDRRAGSANGRAGNEHLSRQTRGVGHRCGHGFLGLAGQGVRATVGAISMLVQVRFRPE